MASLVQKREGKHWVAMGVDTRVYLFEPVVPSAPPDSDLPDEADRAAANEVPGTVFDTCMHYNEGKGHQLLVRLDNIRRMHTDLLNAEPERPDTASGLPDPDRTSIGTGSYEAGMDTALLECTASLLKGLQQ